MQKKNANKQGGGDGEKKEKGSSTSVFKFECLCDGCASKIIKCINQFEGIIAFHACFPFLFLAFPSSFLHPALVIYSVFLCFFFVTGVETVKPEMSSNKVTVIGTADPTAIKEKLDKKTKKKVELISSQPKKDDNKDENKEKKPDQQKKQDSDNKSDKKPKEVQIPIFSISFQNFVTYFLGV